MRNRVYIALCAILLMLATLGCSPKAYPDTVETTRTDTVTVYRDITFRDTVILAQIPQESRETVSADTSSFLQTSVAKSSAKWQNGRLYHSLENRSDVLIPIAVKLPEVQVTTERSQVMTRNEVDIREVRYMAWWQTCFFWIGVAAVVYVIIRIVWKIWGGGITSFAKKLLSL